MKNNGTATYQTWSNGKKLSERTDVARITAKRIKVCPCGIEYIWDRQGARKSLSFFYSYKLISYEIDGVVIVIKY